VDGGSAQCVPGGTRLAQLENAIARFARPRREIGRPPPEPIFVINPFTYSSVRSVTMLQNPWC